jgi:hypothetical protein
VRVDLGPKGHCGSSLTTTVCESIPHRDDHPAMLDLLIEDGLSNGMARVGLVATIFHLCDRSREPAGGGI